MNGKVVCKSSFNCYTAHYVTRPPVTPPSGVHKDRLRHVVVDVLAGTDQQLNETRAQILTWVDHETAIKLVSSKSEADTDESACLQRASWGRLDREFLTGSRISEYTDHDL